MGRMIRFFDFKSKGASPNEINKDLYGLYNSMKKRAKTRIWVGMKEVKIEKMEDELENNPKANEKSLKKKIDRAEVKIEKMIVERDVYAEKLFNWMLKFELEDKLEEFIDLYEEMWDRNVEY